MTIALGEAPPRLPSTKPTSPGLLLALPLLLAAAVGLLMTRDRARQTYQAPPMLWFTSPDAMKRMALGYDSIVSDLYWMRAVVYYGGQRLAADAPANYDLLYHLLDLVTTLDPRFNIAYRFGAVFLADSYPNGPGRPDQAIALLQRGWERTGRWEYLHDIGFVNYWWLNDYPAAAEWFEKAAAVPGAPAYLRGLAATTLAQGGNRQSSRLLWQQVLNAGDAEWMKGNAEFRLRQLDAMDVIDALNEASRRYAERNGRPPASWQELATVVRLQGVPLDPDGTPYALDPTTGIVDLGPESTLRPLPTETVAPPPPPTSDPARPPS